jgi:RNA polymerase sigma-70 factor (ECF subfamily)
MEALAGLPHGLALSNGATGVLGAALDRSYEEARRTWHPVVLDLGVFARHMAVSAAAVPGQSDPLSALESLHATDLYLACAAGHGLPRARELFVTHFFTSIAGAVHAINGEPAFLDEVRQALHERLLLANEGPPRILGYGGRASLASWVGVAAQRLAFGLLRSEGAGRRAAERASDEPWPVELDPELQYLKVRYRAEFKAAVSAAIAGLPERHRTVVRLHTVAGLTLARIAAMLAVDESTVSRWIQRARETILAETERELGERLGMRVSEVPSLVRLVSSHLDVSVARLLTDEGGAREPADGSK